MALMGDIMNDYNECYFGGDISVVVVYTIYKRK